MFLYLMTVSIQLRKYNIACTCLLSFKQYDKVRVHTFYIYRASKGIKYKKSDLAKEGCGQFPTYHKKNFLHYA